MDNKQPLSDIVYVGFWARSLAALIDSILVLCIIIPPLLYFYGAGYFSGQISQFVALSDEFAVLAKGLTAPSAGLATIPALTPISGPLDVVLNWAFPAIAVVLFWIYRAATPGKMAVHAYIVDAKTLAKPTKAQLIGRYLGYYISIFSLGLGFLWIAFDPKKQGWHDKLAGTVVVYRP